MEKHTAIVESGKTRLRPVLMTAMTTILALCTSVFSNDMGSEMMKPMSIVTIGGLTYGTLLTLFVIPVIYDLFNPERLTKEEKKARKRRKKHKIAIESPEEFEGLDEE